MKVSIVLGEQPLNAMDVAQILQVGRNKVYELAQSGELASYRIGRKLRFSRYDVQRYLDSQRIGGMPDALQQQSGPESAIEYLHDVVQPREGFVIAGTDAAMGVFANGLSEAGLPVVCRNINGFASLIAMYLGEVDMALVDLYDAKTNSFNVAYVQRLVPGIPTMVMGVLERHRGFVVARGNPKHITTWGALLKEGVRLAQQEPGTGGRVLLDEKLMTMEARNEGIDGYMGRDTDEFEAARRVARGEADVAICTERAAELAENVDFVPVQAERLDVVIRKSEENRPLVRTVKALLASKHVAREFAGLSGDLARLGVIVYEG